jgi:hypothetical protein
MAARSLGDAWPHGLGFGRLSAPLMIEKIGGLHTAAEHTATLVRGCLSICRCSPPRRGRRTAMRFIFYYWLKRGTGCIRGRLGA